MRPSIDRSQWLPLPFPAPVTASPSAALLRPLDYLALSAACPSGSGAQRWRTAPDTDRTRSCGPPNGSHTAWSCTTTGAYICSRRCRQDTPVVLVPWWFPPAPSPPPPPFPPTRSSLRRAQVLYHHIRLCVLLLLEEHTMTSRPCKTACRYSRL